jgi:hypothetical protein
MCVYRASLRDTVLYLWQLYDMNYYWCRRTMMRDTILMTVIWDELLFLSQHYGTNWYLYRRNIMRTPTLTTRVWCEHSKQVSINLTANTTTTTDKCLARKNRFENTQCFCTSYRTQRVWHTSVSVGIHLFASSNTTQLLSRYKGITLTVTVHGQWR